MLYVSVLTHLLCWEYPHQVMTVAIVASAHASTRTNLSAVIQKMADTIASIQVLNASMTTT